MSLSLPKQAEVLVAELCEGISSKPRPLAAPVEVEASVRRTIMAAFPAALPTPSQPQPEAPPLALVHPPSPRPEAPQVSQAPPVGPIHFAVPLELVHPGGLPVLTGLLDARVRRCKRCVETGDEHGVAAQCPGRWQKNSCYLLLDLSSRKPRECSKCSAAGVPFPLKLLCKGSGNLSLCNLGQ